MNTNIQHSTKLSGQYKVMISHVDGSVTETHWIDNLILNSGMDDLGTNGLSLASYVHVGTGTTTPDVNQVALDAKIATKAADAISRVGLGSPTYKSEMSYTFTFDQGAVVGNITEVGVSQALAGTRLFSRALFMSGGTPVAITVVALDQLTIVYKLTVTPPLTDFTGTVVIGGTSYGYTGRVGAVSTFFQSAVGLHSGSQTLIGCTAYQTNAALGAVTAQTTGTVNGSATSFVPVAYSTGSYTKTTTAVFSSAVSNAASGIKGFLCQFGGSGHYYQYVLDAAIPKTNTNELRINFTTSWARA